MTTGIDRLERLTNLVAILLDTRRPLTIDEIVRAVPGYPDDLVAYRRQFEHDKDTLRGLGVPLSVESLDAFGPETGYRIRPEEYHLPELDLSAEERAALHVAVTAVRLEGGEGEEALWKLGGVEGEGGPTVAALEVQPTLPDLFEAYRTRSAVTFGYRGRRRVLDPWGVLFRQGHWYVVGRAHDRDAQRSFRVDRVEAPVEIGPPGTFDVPDRDPGTMIRDEPWTFGDETPVESRVLADPVVAADWTRRFGENLMERHHDGSAVFRFEVSDREGFRSFIAGHLDRVEVLSPEALRDQFVAWLEAIVTEAEPR